MEMGELLEYHELNATIKPTPTIFTADVIRHGEDMEMKEELVVPEEIRRLWPRGMPDISIHHQARTICSAYGTEEKFSQPTTGFTVGGRRMTPRETVRAQGNPQYMPLPPGNEETWEKSGASHAPRRSQALM